MNGAISSSPFRNFTTCMISAAPSTSMLSTTAASAALLSGIMMPLYPSSLALSVMGNAPFIGISLPSSPNSPIIRYCSSLSVFTASSAANMPMAIGRSYAEPSFLMSAGAMFTIIFLLGKRNPLCVSAEFILCWLSFTALSGSPTRKNLIPLRAFTSMVTSVALMP